MQFFANAELCNEDHECQVGTKLPMDTPMH